MTGRQDHLNDSRFTECMLGGELPADIAAHLAGCEACREELERFRGAVGELSAAALVWSEARRPETLSAARGQQTVLTPRFAVAAWGAAVCALLAVGVTPLLHHERAPERPAATAGLEAEDTEAQIAQDNKLMRAVDMELAEGEPSPYREYRLAPAAQRKGRMQTRVQ